MSDRDKAAPRDWTRVSLLWAVQGHSAGIAALHGALFPRPWDEAEIGRLLAHPGSIALVASAGNPADLGGFALAQVAADEAEILTLGVASDWQRHGVGSRLVDGIKRASARAGAASVVLEVAESNMAARGLYRRAGFEETARRPGYYQLDGAPAEDAIVMRATLAASTA